MTEPVVLEWEGWSNNLVALIEPNVYHAHSYEDSIDATMRMLAFLPVDATMHPMGHYWSNGKLVAQMTATGQGTMSKWLGDEVQAEVDAFAGDSPEKSRFYVDISMLYWPFIAANEQIDEMMVACDANVRHSNDSRFTEGLVINHLMPGRTETLMRGYRRNEKGLIVEWDDDIGKGSEAGGRMSMLADSVTEVRLNTEQEDPTALETIVVGLIQEKAAQFMLPKEPPWTTLQEHYE